jgi:NTE family protein
VKYQLVFAGGGAKGSYQIGVWKALKELNIEIDMVIGTSIGSINGAIVVCDEFDKAQELWETLDMSALFNLPAENAKGEPNTIEYVESILKNKGLDTSSLRTYLNDVIKEDSFRRSQIDYALVTFSLSQMKPVILFKNDIPEGRLLDFVMASSALPGLIKQEIEGEVYVDGGVYDNMPINVLIDHGYKNIIAVSNFAIGMYKKTKETDANIIIIENKGILGNIMEFNPNNARKNILLGYLDGMKAFGRYIGKSYYMKESHESILSAPLSEKEIDMLYLNLKNNRKTLVPRSLLQFQLLRTLRDHSVGFLTQQRALYAAIEITADVLGIEKTREYAVDEIIQAELDAYGAIKKEAPETSVTDKKFFNNIMNKIWDRKKLRFNNAAMRKIYLGHVLIDKDAVSFDTNTLTEYLIANLFIYLMLWRKKKNKAAGEN